MTTSQLGGDRHRHRGARTQGAADPALQGPRWDERGAALGDHDGSRPNAASHADQDETKNSSGGSGEAHTGLMDSGSRRDLRAMTRTTRPRAAHRAHATVHSPTPRTRPPSEWFFF